MSAPAAIESTDSVARSLFQDECPSQERSGPVGASEIDQRHSGRQRRLNVA